MTLAASAPPLGADQLLHLLLQLGVLLAAALCLGRLARRVGLPAVVGELLTGVLLGPSLLGWVAPGFSAWFLPPRAEQAHLLDAVGQLGVLLLVGLTGAHLDGRLLRRRAGTVAKVSLGGLAVPFALGLAAGFLVPAALVSEKGDRHTFAVFIGVAMCVSAIPVIAKTLTDMGLMHRDIGQLTLASATIDDAVGWFLLSLVSAMAVGGPLSGDITVSAISLVAFVLLAATVGRVGVRAVLRLAGRSAEGGPTVATAAVIILLGAAASHALGLEPVFGAFLAGMLIGAPRVVEPARMAPLHTVVMWVLAPIFLACAGLRVDLTALADPAVLLAGLCLLAIAVVGKFVGAYAGARLSRLTHWEGIALGAGLNARGVVEIVVASVGLRLGVLTTATYTIVVLIAVLTSVMAPPMLRWSMRRVELTATEKLRETEIAAWTEPVPVTADTDRGTR